MIGQFSPQLRADEDVLPFRLVMMNDSGEGRETSGATSVVIGVSQGSNRRFDDDNHAIIGEPINLQPGTYVRVEAGEAISVPSLIRPSAQGLAMVVDTETDIVCGEAMEDAADPNEIFLMRLIPAATAKS